MIKKFMKGAQIEDLSKVRFPVYGSRKIDGFRCLLGKHPMTSSLSRFPNDFFHKELKGVLPANCFLDAEAVVGKKRGKGVLQRTSSGLTSEEGEPDFRLWVFDRPCLPDAPGWYSRYLAAHDLIGSIDHPRIRLLKHRLIGNLNELEEFIEDSIEREYEGIIIRSPDGPYKEGKSTIREGYMNKIKPFVDFEARILGYYEEMENTNAAKKDKTGKSKRSSSKEGKKAKGTLGGFIGIELKTGVEVRVGGGFSKEQRKHFWAIKDELVAAGAIMKCSKQQMGEKNKPRHANFLDLRPGWDIAA